MYQDDHKECSASIPNVIFLTHIKPTLFGLLYLVLLWIDLKVYPEDSSGISYAEANKASVYTI